LLLPTLLRFNTLLLLAEVVVALEELAQAVGVLAVIARRLDFR
jgi:hypothetical protein